MANNPDVLESSALTTRLRRGNCSNATSGVYGRPQSGGEGWSPGTFC